MAIKIWCSLFHKVYWIDFIGNAYCPKCKRYVYDD